MNGQVEMAAAFDRAGFAAVDVHMSDLLAGRTDLAEFRGLAACGGFSYGDVLGAGSGYVLAACHNLQPDVLVENILAMYTHAREYKPYYR